MTSAIVHVKNISPQTSEKEVRDFFSFCGKISSLTVTPSSDAKESQTATVTFEKETAAKTALLLDNTQLGPSQVQVSSGAGLSDIASSATGKGDEAANDSSELDQEDKPRSRIVAEYLAHGYVLTDTALQNAIALDNKHGISSRFTQTLANFDSKYKATDKAKGIDQSYGISEKGGRAWAGVSSYFEKALGTPTGQKIVSFYVSGDKQVRDIHNEAKRLADIKSNKSTGPASEGGTLAANQTTLEQVAGTEKTVCKCGGDTGVCPCGEGKCACSGCAKSGLASEKSATGTADKVAQDTKIDPLSEKTPVT